MENMEPPSASSSVRVMSEENDEPVRKRPRLSQVHSNRRVPELPSEVLAQVFSTLDGPSLARTAEVCRQWRDTGHEHGALLWRELCAKFGLLDETSVCAAAAKRVTKQAAKIRSKNHTSAERRVAAVYRSYYVKMRERVCAHCLTIKRQRLVYSLYGVRLCIPCRSLEPYAFITKTNARRYFRVGGPLVRESVEAPLARQDVHFGGQCGIIFRFDEVVALARKHLGNFEAKSRAARARRELGIRQMHIAHLNVI